MAIPVIGVLLFHMFHQPSWSTLLLFWANSKPLDMNISTVFELLACETTLRATVVMALVVHEMSHLAAAKALTLFSKSVCFRWELHFPAMMWALLPGGQVQSSCLLLLTPHGRKKQQEAAFGSGADLSIKLAGLVASALVPMAVFSCSVGSDSGRFPTLLFQAIQAGSLLPLAGALLSDLPCGPLLGPHPPAGCFCCGNWGLLLAREALKTKLGGSGGDHKELLPGTLQELLKSVLDIVELRGAQAGGCVTFVGAGHGQVEAVLSRTVKSKRGHLGAMLFRHFNREMLKRCLAKLAHCGRLRQLPVILVQGHSRFGTSSSPAVIETHPHQWLGPHLEWVWRCDSASVWSRQRETVCTTITHNGDFDGSVLYENTVPNGVLGEWLARVLHWQNRAKGDSPKLAGMMDLLICQGMWTAAVRCAFVFHVLHHVDEAFGWEAAGPDGPNTVPEEHIFREWAEVFEDIFEGFALGQGFVPSAEGISKVAMAARCAFESPDMSKAASKAAQQWGMSGELVLSFCQQVVAHFFERDVLSSVWFFFRRSVGTFGISVSCSLWPESIVMAAKGQPISIAFDADNTLAFWSSEPNSLDVPFAWRSGAAPKRVAAARWDMDDARGEAIELRSLEAKTAPEDALGLLPVKATFFALPGGSPEGAGRRIVVRGMSLGGMPKALDYESFKARWVRLRAPPPALVPSGRGDPIATDLQDVPAVLAELEDSWTDPTALNFQSGSRFAKCLLYLLSAPRHAGGDPAAAGMDVLLFGMENSLWLAQQFAADLSRLFPQLNVTALSANWVLGLLQKAQGQIEPLNFALPCERFTFRRGAIAMAVSHSGTTYPTVWCARLLSQRAEQLNVFAMSGVLESVLANSIGQSMTKTEFSGRLFTTMAGIRPSEPSTVATLAMHHSFSLLLLACARVATVSMWDRQDAGGKGPSLSARERPICRMWPSDIPDFQRVLGSLLPAAERLCGVSQQRQQLPSHARQELLKVGKYFSSQFLEVWYSTLLAALYVYITVTCGTPLVSWCWDLVSSEVDWPEWVYSGPDWFHSGRLHVSLKYVAGHIDSHLYVFLAALLATAHRLLSGRRLFTRFTSRKVVLVDSTVNYKLLRAYVSKLGALSFRFTAFGVAGQNGVDHFVHEMTHLTTSEVILFVGRPDGRLGTLAATERAVVLSTMQARFVASRANSGVEIVSLGHNPWTKPNLCVMDVALPTNFRPQFLSSVLLQSSRGPQDPLDVCHRLAMMKGGSRGGRRVPTDGAPFGWVTKASVQDAMHRLPSVAPGVARAIVLQFVEDSQEALGVDATGFDVTHVLTTSEEDLNAPNTNTSEPAFFQSEGSERSLAAPRPSFRRASSTASILSSLTARMKSTNLDFTSTDIIAVLRGRKMQEEVERLRRQKVHKDVARNWGVQRQEESLRQICAAWLALAREAGVQQRLTRQTSGGKEHLPVCAEWRVREEYRRRRRQWLTSFRNSKFSTHSCFVAWRGQLRRGSLVFARTSSKDSQDCPSRIPSKDCLSERIEEGVAPVGGTALMGKATHEELVSQLALMERLYETRVAAAERLLASFIVFHAAVRPLSKLFGLSYDMDRSESRLRVASTPAPVPFVEDFAPGFAAAGSTSGAESMLFKTFKEGFTREYSAAKAKSTFAQVFNI